MGSLRVGLEVSYIHSIWYVLYILKFLLLIFPGVCLEMLYYLEMTTYGSDLEKRSRSLRLRPDRPMTTLALFCILAS